MKTLEEIKKEVEKLVNQYNKQAKKEKSLTRLGFMFADQQDMIEAPFIEISIKVIQAEDGTPLIRELTEWAEKTGYYLYPKNNINFNCEFHIEVEDEKEAEKFVNKLKKFKTVESVTFTLPEEEALEWDSDMRPYLSFGPREASGWFPSQFC